MAMMDRKDIQVLTHCVARPSSSSSTRGFSGQCSLEHVLVASGSQGEEGHGRVNCWYTRFKDGEGALCPVSNNSMHTVFEPALQELHCVVGRVPSCKHDVSVKDMHYSGTNLI